MSRFLYVYSCDLSANVEVKIMSVEGMISKLTTSDILANPSLYHCVALHQNQQLDPSLSAANPSIGGGSSNQPSASFGAGSNKDCYITAQVFCDSEPIGMAVQTSYHCQSTSSSARNRWRWNEWLRLPITYRELSRDAVLLVKLWDIHEDAEPHCIAITTMPFFSKRGVFRKGMYDLRLEPYRRRSSPTAEDEGIHSSSSSADDRPIDTDYLHCLALTRESAKTKSSGKMIELSKMSKKHRAGLMPKVDWLDRLTFRQIEVINEREKRESNHLYLMLQFPRIHYSSSATVAPVDGLTGVGGAGGGGQGEEGEYSVVYFEQNGQQNTWWTPNPPVVKYLDGEIGLENLVEAKHSALTRRTGGASLQAIRALKPNLVAIVQLKIALNRPPSDGTMTGQQRDLLWKFRYWLSTNERALPKFLLSVNWDSDREVQEAIGLLNEWSPINVDDALELLAAHFQHPAVRSYAVQRLRQTPVESLLLYLPQLVQALKYEPNTRMINTTLMTGSSLSNAGASQEGKGSSTADTFDCCYSVYANLTSESDSCSSSSAYPSMTGSGGSAGNSNGGSKVEHPRSGSASMQSSSTSMKSSDGGVGQQQSSDSSNQDQSKEGGGGPQIALAIHSAMSADSMAATSDSAGVMDASQTSTNSTMAGSQQQAQHQRSIQQLTASTTDSVGGGSVAGEEKLNLTGLLIQCAVENFTFASKLFWYLNVEEQLERTQTGGGAGMLPGGPPGIVVGGDTGGSGGGEDGSGGGSGIGLYARVLQQLSSALLRGGNVVARKSRTVLYEQQSFVQKLVQIMKAVAKESGNRTKKVEFLKSELYNSDLLRDLRGLPHPLDPSMRMDRIVVERAILFNSALMPAKFTFQLTDGREFTTIFKVGDDLRQDELIIQMIQLIDKLLKDENMDLQLTPYKVMATSPTDGFVEYVESIPLSDVLKQHTTILDFFRHHRPSSRDDLNIEKPVLDAYIRSSAGYSVISYVLGIGDRHLHNLLLARDGHLFHIDFGYILGRDPKPLPPPIKLTKEMIDGMGGLSSAGWSEYRRLCYTAYIHLRRHSNLILNLFRLMLNSSIPDIALEPDKALYKIEERLKLNLDEEEAVKHMQTIIDDSKSARMPILSDLVHELVQKL